MLICLIFIYSFILFYVCLFSKKQQKECGCRCEGPGIQGGVGGKETGIRIHERSQFSIKEKKNENVPELESLYGSYRLTLFAHFEQEEADIIGLYSMPSVLLAKKSTTLKQCKRKLCKFKLKLSQ